jgi:osmotically-inducible protein OsmY
MNPREAITRQIHGLLERERRINLHRFPIRISNADGVAVLEGEVGDIAAKKLALELAGSVPGVRGVVDRLRVAPGARPGEGRRGDGEVRDSLARRFLEQPELRNCSLRVHTNERDEVLREGNGDSVGEIQISVSDGVIVLEGHVISQPHRLFAGVLAWWTPGRRDVINSLEVQPSYDENDDELTEALRLVLEADPEVDAAQVRPAVEKWVLTHHGTVATQEQNTRAEKDSR